MMFFSLMYFQDITKKKMFSNEIRIFVIRGDDKNWEITFLTGCILKVTHLLRWAKQNHIIMYRQKQT